MEVMLEDNGLKEFIDNIVSKPTSSDVALLDTWQKRVAKKRRIMLEGVKDHIVSSLQGISTPFAMWKALIDIFQSSSDHWNLVLKDKLRKIKMEKGDNIPKYLTNFVLCRDELGSVRITVVDDELLSLALLGLLKSYHSYKDSVNGWEKLRDWERLWSDLAQEELRRNTRDGSSSKNYYEENCALDAKSRKGKGDKSHPKSEDIGKKLDLSQMKCFHYHKHGHLTTNFPQKKKKRRLLEL